MNLSELRTWFLELSGRPDLDENDASGKKKADFFIQAGQRFLDLGQPNPESERWYKRDVSSGDWKLSFNHCRFVKEVWAEDSEGRYELARRDEDWIRKYYSERVSQKAVGSMVFSSNSGLTGDNIIVDDTTFELDVDIEVGATLADTLANVAAAINANVDSVTAEVFGTDTVLVQAAAEGGAGNSIVFSTDSDKITMDGSGYLGGYRIGVSNQTDPGYPKYYAPVCQKLSPDQRTLSEMSAASQFTGDYYNMLFGSSSVGYRVVVWMPPVDGDYTISVMADWFSVLVEETDVTYWTQVFPEASLQAALLAVEVFYRNLTGVSDMLIVLQPILRGIDHDMVAKESHDANQREG